MTITTTYQAQCSVCGKQAAVDQKTRQYPVDWHVVQAISCEALYRPPYRGIGCNDYDDEPRWSKRALCPACWARAAPLIGEA